MRNQRVFISIMLLCLGAVAFALQPSKLTCEMQLEPIAVEALAPRFGWQLSTDLAGDKQHAYQLTVSQNGQKVWDSGKVISDQSQLVPYKGSPLGTGKQYDWRVTVWNTKGIAFQSQPAHFETAPVLATNNVQWIGAISRENSHLPIGRRDFHIPSFKSPATKAIFDQIDTLSLKSIQLRKQFAVSKELLKATVHLSGLGHYHLTLNGKEVTKDLFTPAWSDYDKTIYYNTYQVKELLKSGDNAVGVLLGNGFFNAVGTRYSKLWVTFGPPTLFFQLHLYYKDGTEQVVSSDKNWKYVLSPITFNDIYGGEDHDARLEQAGWDQAGFDDLNWKPVVIQEPPLGILRPQQLPAIRNMKQFGAQKMEKIGASYILDMGQNLSGYPVIKVIGKRGQTVKLTVGELLRQKEGKDGSLIGTVSQSQSGGPHTYSYTLKGDGVEEWHPQFSYYGFRYIQVDGADLLSSDQTTDRPLLVDVKSCFVYNSTDEVGNFTCSNDLFNKAHVLIKNAVKSNMQAIFTDCPHREKLGWLEETHLNGPGLLYNWNLTQYFPKVMRDMADGQRSGGLIPSIVPEYCVFGGDFSDSPEWGGAVVILPWMYYQFYGDDTLLRTYYKVMKGYVDYLSSKAKGHIVSHGLGDWYDYGDHPAGYAKNSPVEVSATAHYYYVTHLLAEAAKLLSNKRDQQHYGELAAEIRKAFNSSFFNQESKQYGSGSQFCNAVALFMNIVEPQHRAAVMENLTADIKQRGNRLTTGDVGNRYLFQALALNGANELMYLLNNHEEAPGYGFQIKYGVTTLTEQWDPRKGASWNHFMMGQIDEWFFRSLAGITPTKAGFKEFTIQPQPVGDLTWVKAFHQTMYGKISVEWELREGVFALTVEVPTNTIATVVLPNGKRHVVGGGTYQF